MESDDKKILKRWIAAPCESISFSSGQALGVWLKLNEQVEWYYACDTKDNKRVIGYNVKKEGDL